MNVALYVSGSIAAYKSLILVRLLKKSGANVKIVMTREATRFIQPLAFQALSHHRVISSWNDDYSGILHVKLSHWTDVAIIAPATANVIAKVANGIADDVASTCLLATSAPKVIVPAMNNRMFDNPVTQRNLNWLRQLPGYRILGPVAGPLAEGYSGKGRMVEPNQIIAKVNRWFRDDRPLKSMKLIVTAGGTREKLDPVRFITNDSSGKMGCAIANQAAKLGAKVLLISGHTVSLRINPKIKIIHVQTTENMAQAVLKNFPHFNGLIMAAALADFRPVTFQSQKIKKRNQLILKLRRTPDVLKMIAKVKRQDQFTVGFAAETHDLLKHATQKLVKKHLDLIVANDVANPKIGFGSDNNQVTLIRRGHSPVKTQIAAKSKIAQVILKTVIKIWKGGKR